MKQEDQNYSYFIVPIENDVLRREDKVKPVGGEHLSIYHVLCVKSVQKESFFWSVFSCIRTEYGNLRSKFPYPVRIQ